MRFNLIYLVSLVASQFTFDTYSSVIASVKLPTYSAIQRQSIISQIKNLLAIYVNAESKFDYYHYTPSINDLESANTDFDFHSKASNLFLRFRDFHTNYYLPGPYSCYRLIYPLDFDFYGNQILVSSLFFDKSNKHDLNLSGIDIGDELVFFNNMTFSQIYELKKEAIGGANLYGSMRSVLTFLSFQSGKLYILPTETTVEYTLMKPNGTIYKTRHPVLARYSKQCVASFKKSKPSNYRMISERDTPTIDHDDMMIHPYLHELPEQSNSLLKTSEDFSYKIYKTKTNFVLGVLKISSFIPKTDPKTALRNLITLLYNELFNTSALIIDVRNNGGGAISLADSIPQLFIQNIKTASARALKSNINTRIFLNPEFKTDWGPAYRDSNGTYSKLVKFTSDRIANYIGQVYLKPIALLTNSACYSACDLFTANLKDAGVTIFGHDSTTGGYILLI